MNITDMRYVIASQYNVIVASHLLSVHHVICIGHVYENHFVQVIT